MYVSGIPKPYSVAMGCLLISRELSPSGRRYRSDNNKIIREITPFEGEKRGSGSTDGDPFSSNMIK
jgi:hypothetical protein